MNSAHHYTFDSHFKGTQDSVNNIHKRVHCDNFMVHHSSSTSFFLNTQQLYRYTSDLFNLDRCRGLLRCVNIPRAACNMTSRVVVAEWSQLIQDFHSRQYVEYHLQGIRESFRIGFSWEFSSAKAVGNMRSALNNP